MSLNVLGAPFLKWDEVVKTGHLNSTDVRAIDSSLHRSAWRRSYIKASETVKFSTQSLIKNFRNRWQWLVKGVKCRLSKLTWDTFKEINATNVHTTQINKATGGMVSHPENKEGISEQHQLKYQSSPHTQDLIDVWYLILTFTLHQEEIVHSQL